MTWTRSSTLVGLPEFLARARGKPIGYSLDLCEIVVEEIAAELGGELKVQYVPVTPENRFDLVTSNTVDLERGSTFANDDVQLYGMLAETRSAADFRVVGDFLTYADYALMFRKDDPNFTAVVERAFQRLSGSRKVVAIYERWFRNPLPSGARLNLQMSPHLEHLFQAHGLPSSD